MKKIHFDHATKTQLIHIALHEDCSLCLKYESLRELQLRWSNNMFPELIGLYGKGMSVSDIAYELGIDPHTVKNKLKQTGLYKRRVIS